MSKALITTILLLFLFGNSNAQLIENFENGNITSNPIWEGNIANFSVTGSNQLRLNAPTTLTSSYISSPLILNNLKNNEWNISIRHDFASSTTNRSRVYIASDVSTLSSTNLNGYYLQIGETGNGDVVSLFRQTGNTSTSLLRGTTTIASAFLIDIKLTYSNSGLWELFVKSTTSSVFGNAEASVLDVTNNSANYFGIFVNYTTTNRQSFWFDNITVTSLPDIYPPELQSVTTLGLNILQLEFSEAISNATSSLLGNYLLNNIQNPTEISVVGINKVNLTFSGITFSGSNTISVSGIKDLAGNTILPNSTLSFNFSIPIPPYIFSYRDIVINEIMADINPAPNGILAVEYIEIYNTKQQTINLQNIILRDYASSGTFVNKTITGITTIAGNGFLILCSNSAKTSFAGLNIPIYSFSTLDPSTEDKFEILDTQGNVIDQVEYFSNWYKNSSKSSGGWSLEQINPNTTCTGSSNWAATTNTNGGTPGLQNSIFTNTNTGKKPTILSVKILNLTQVGIRFSNIISPFSNQIIVSSTSLGIGNINNIADSVLVNFTSPVDSGIVHHLQIKNIQNCEGQLITDTIALISLPKKAKVGNIIFSEIYADETPSNGLPEGEFLEIYNSTNYVLDLSLYKLWDLISAGTFPAGTNILPKAYLILSNTTNANLYSSFGKTVGVPSFPSLNATGDDISIRNPQGQTICSIKYVDSWYGNQNKKDGGWSLEKIDLSAACENNTYWTASVNTIGGTPGKTNSVSTFLPIFKKPYIQSFSFLNATNLCVKFSEQVFPYSQNFTLTNSLLGVSQTNQKPDSLIITFSNPLDSSKAYPLNLKNFQNCSLQIVTDTTILITVAKKAKKGDIVFSEIYADETPSNGLPEGEFIEIYNSSDYVLDLSLYKLWDLTSAGTIPAGTTILPKSYLILSNTTNASLYASFGKTVGVPSFPSLNATGDDISIKNPQGQTICRIKYADSWYGNQNKQDGGWSLEKIDLNNVCESTSNWTSSVDTKGGTPGKVNSIASINPDLTPPNLLSAFAISDSTLIINFDDILDSISVFDAKIYLSNSIQYTTRHIGLQDITLNVSPKLFSKTNYVISILGIKDCALNQQNNLQTKTFVLPESANKNDVLINEVLFNPRTGGEDFVEIYNYSTKTINLKDWMLANIDKDGKIANRKNISLENILFEPKSYKVFTTDNLNIWNNYPKSVKENFVEMPSFPSYADDEGTVVLLNPDSVNIDNFAYKDDYHYALLEDKSGISLERIRFDLPTQEPSNWQSAATSAGNATPGFKNSQSAVENTSIAKTLSFDPIVFTPDDDGWRDFTLITCQLPTNGYTISLQIFDVEGRMIKNIANNILVGTQAIFKWDGLDDTNKRVSTGTYMLLLEGFTLDGNKITDKKNVVVGSKF